MSDGKSLDEQMELAATPLNKNVDSPCGHLENVQL